MKGNALSLTSFRDLKEALERKGCVLKDRVRQVEEIRDNRTDEEVFLEAMADVKEIKKFRDIPCKSRPKVPVRAVKGEDYVEVLRQIVGGTRKIRLSDTGEYIEWSSPAARGDIAGRLHGGDFSVQDYIDLHGMTLGEAEESLRRFFREAVRRSLFCVKVIHGRGLRSPKEPVLKEALKRWLQGTFKKRVVAYATARDCDGGLGATYIILKPR